MLQCVYIEIIFKNVLSGGLCAKLDGGAAFERRLRRRCDCGGGGFLPGLLEELVSSPKAVLILSFILLFFVIGP